MAYGKYAFVRVVGWEDEGLNKAFMNTKHLTPALSPFCSADSAKRGEGETLPAS